MSSLINKNSGLKLLHQTKLLNGSGKENLKLLSQKEIEKFRKNLPIYRKKSDQS